MLGILIPIFLGTSAEVDWLDRAVGPVGIGQRVTGAGQLDMLYFAKDHLMRADFLGEYNPAIKRRQRVNDDGRSGYMGCPVGGLELVRYGILIPSGEYVSDIGLMIAQDIDAEDTIAKDVRSRCTVFVYANQYSRPVGIRRY